MFSKTDMASRWITHRGVSGGAGRHVNIAPLVIPIKRGCRGWHVRMFALTAIFGQVTQHMNTRSEIKTLATTKLHFHRFVYVADGAEAGPASRN